MKSNERALVDNYKPSSKQVDKFLSDSLERAGGDTELLTRGMAWVTTKLLVEVEILKELLDRELYRGRTSHKPRGLDTGNARSKKRPAGAPVQHNLGGSTKAHVIAAYEQFFSQAQESASDAARMYLIEQGVDINSRKGKSLVGNFRRRINEFHLRSNGKRLRRPIGRKP
jgi:hypothetical protein